MTSTRLTTPLTTTTPAAAQQEADQRIAALRGQLAVVQAERALLHTRTATPSAWPAAKSEHGVGGWIFAGLSFVFFLSMIVFAATRPPTVRVVEVEVTREVLVPQAPEPAALHAASAEPETVAEAPAETTRPTRGRTTRATRETSTAGTSGTTGSTRTGLMIDLDRCAGDPLCGS